VQLRYKRTTHMQFRHRILCIQVCHKCAIICAHIHVHVCLFVHSHQFLYMYEALLVKQRTFLREWKSTRLQSEICILLKHQWKLIKCHILSFSSLCKFIDNYWHVHVLMFINTCLIFSYQKWEENWNSHLNELTPYFNIFSLYKNDNKLEWYMYYLAIACLRREDVVKFVSSLLGIIEWNLIDSMNNVKGIHAVMKDVYITNVPSNCHTLDANHWKEAVLGKGRGCGWVLNCLNFKMLFHCFTVTL